MGYATPTRTPYPTQSAQVDMEVCKPLVRGLRRWTPLGGPPSGRGLHSTTFRLNLSALHGIGGERRSCVAHVKGVSGVVEGVQGVFFNQTRLKLS